MYVCVRDMPVLGCCVCVLTLDDVISPTSRATRRGTHAQTRPRLAAMRIGWSQFAFVPAHPGRIVLRPDSGREVHARLSLAYLCASSSRNAR